MTSPSLAQDRLDMLRALYKTSVPAAKMLENFANRKRDRRIVEVGRVQEILPELDRSSIVEVFRKLAEIGFGHFVIGRRGAPSRFEWTVSLQSVGKAAMGHGEVEAVADNEIEEEESSSPQPVRHEYRLRPDFTARLELPADLTAREAIRLADFIRTLPFDE